MCGRPGFQLITEVHNVGVRFGHVRYDTPMKADRNEKGDFGKFTEFMKRLVSVPHSEIKAKLDAEKQRKRQRKKRASAAHVSPATD